MHITLMEGEISSLNSRNNVSVDGTLRHVLDVRKIITVTDADKRNDQEDRDLASGTDAWSGVMSLFMFTL